MTLQCDIQAMGLTLSEWAPKEGSAAVKSLQQLFSPRRLVFHVTNVVETTTKGRQCKDECLQCKTKSHDNWSQQRPLFMAWRDNKQQKGQCHEGSKNPWASSPCPPASGSTVQLLVALQAHLSTTSAQLAAIRGGQKKRFFLDSGANISIVSSLSQLYCNKIKTVFRALRRGDSQQLNHGGSEQRKF